MTNAGPTDGRYNESPTSKTVASSQSASTGSMPASRNASFDNVMFATVTLRSVIGTYKYSRLSPGMVAMSCPLSALVEKHWADPALRVDTSGHRLKVVRVDTTGVTAKMVDVETAWDRSNEPFPNKPMDVLTTAIENEVAVSRGKFGSQPLPAETNVDLLPEPFLRRARVAHP